MAIRKIRAEAKGYGRTVTDCIADGENKLFKFFHNPVRSKITFSYHNAEPLETNLDGSVSIWQMLVIGSVDVTVQ